MNRRTYDGWMRAGIDAWALGFEASTVIGLRLAKMAGGGGAAMKEAELMVAEKVRAGIELQAALIGTTPLAGTQKAVSHYRRKVAANRRRLSGGKTRAAR